MDEAFLRCYIKKEGNRETEECRTPLSEEEIGLFERTPVGKVIASLAIPTVIRQLITIVCNRRNSTMRQSLHRKRRKNENLVNA